MVGASQCDAAWLKRFVAIVLATAVFLTIGCSHRGGDAPAELNGPELPKVDASHRAELCPPSVGAKNLNRGSTIQATQEQDFSFTQLKDGVNSACKNCHMAPSENGGFTYVDSLNAQTLTMGGVTRTYPGLAESVEKIAGAVFNSDSNLQMPPAEIRQANPKAFLKLGAEVNAWIASGKPSGSFQITAPSGSSPATNETENSVDCVPDTKIIGYDYALDRKFASLTQLPQNLADTDLTSLDAFYLAQKGTIAYSVEYPLWADNAEKGRWVHIPMKVVDGKKLERQSINFDPRTKNFAIPDNTRFYKTFYRSIKTADGGTRYRRVETRLIVVRAKPAEPLYGTYRWDEKEQGAVLVDAPYRDGTGFKDQLFDLTVNEATGEKRKYAIPGKQRCLECHMGSENRSFALGFTPLQIHRRAKDEGGSENQPIAADLSQAQRLLKYGVVAGFSNEGSLPMLEWQGDFAPRNQYELRAQAYMVGNCAHCHNQNGFAFTPDNGVNLALTAGSIFNFNTQTRSSEMPSHRIVHQMGDLAQSQLFHKIADPPDQQGMTSQMPMDTPGLPNCSAIRIIGKWIKSFESTAAADAWEPDCQPSADFAWIDQDFTSPKSDKFTPRRADWSDENAGMPKKFRDLRLTPELDSAISKTYPVGYWSAKNTCIFPKIDLPEEDQRPWMLKDGEPKRPFGEVYSTTPGSWYFRTTCVKCHGTSADGNSALAKGILNWSGGSVRVANLRDGLFGNGGENLKVFDLDQGNYAGNYLIWMAMEGTRVKFPPQLSPFVGSHGGKMLNLVREKCRNQISSDKTSTPIFIDHEIFRSICFAGNREPGDPDLAYDTNTNQPVNPAAVEEWLDRGAYNAGWAIYKYLLNGSHGDWQPGNDECEKVFPSGQAVK